MSASIFSLKSKVAIITGGYGHLGSAITEALAAAGANVVVAGKDKQKFTEKLSSHPAISFMPFDVSSTKLIATGYKQVLKTFKQIDILVNVAFYSKGNSPEKLSDPEWEYGLDGTLGSVHRCIREIIPYLKKSQGNILNIASMYGIVAPDFRAYKRFPQFTNPPHYGAAKAGVIQLTRYYASYLAGDRIRVNCISPGAFPGETAQQQKRFIKELTTRIPLGRIGTPQEVSGAAVFLSSNAASYITGHNLVIDGGWTIR